MKGTVYIRASDNAAFLSLGFRKYCSLAVRLVQHDVPAINKVVFKPEIKLTPRL